MTAPLPGILQTLAPILDDYGYAAVIALVGLEGFGIPAPGQTILIAAGIYAGAQRLNVDVVLILGFLAAVGGDNIGYAIGHFGGRPLVLRFGRYVGLTEDRLAAAERFFVKRGNVVVPIARFIDGLRQANGIVAGLARMPWWRFLAFNAIGAAAWVGVWVLVGYFAGDHITTIYAEFDRYEKYVLALLAVIAIALIGRWLLRRRSRQAGQ